MKRALFISLCSILLLSSAAIVTFICFRQPRAITGTKDFSFLRNGDLILRQGRSVESFAVYILDKNHDFSHIGVVAYENHKPYIIHVVPDAPGQVRKDLPSTFLSGKNASRYRILRSDFCRANLDRVAENAMNFYSRKLLFDNNYDLSTEQELYCSELVIRAFEKSNLCLPGILPQKISLLTGVYYIIMPGIFLSNSHFTTVRAG